MTRRHRQSQACEQAYQQPCQAVSRAAAV